MHCLDHCESTLTAPPNLFRETAPAPAPRLISPSRSSNVLRSFQDPSPAAPAPAPVYVTEQNFAGDGQIEQELEVSFLLWNFDVGQDRLKAGHIDAIKSLAPTLKARLASDADAGIDIEGRASATGTKNQALSECRANAVRDALVKEGIDAGRINRQPSSARRTPMIPAGPEPREWIPGPRQGWKPRHPAKGHGRQLYDDAGPRAEHHEPEMDRQQRLHADGWEELRRHVAQHPQPAEEKEKKVKL